MSLRGNIVLLIVAVVLGAVCVIDSHLFRPPGEREEAEKMVFDYEEGALGAFEVTRGEVSFGLEKGVDDSLWHVVNPVHSPADQAAADNVAFELRTLRKNWTGTWKEGDDLSRYGLDEPRLHLRLRVRERPEDLYVGDETPAGDVYILVKGKETALYSVRKSLFDTLARDLDEFRERRLVPFETYNVQNLVLRQGMWQLQWGRLEKGWEVSTIGKAADPADQGEVDRVLRRIQDLQAVGFQDGVTEEAAGAMGLGGGATPRLIQIGLKNDDTPLVAELGEPLERDGQRQVPARRHPLELSRTVLFLPETALQDFGRDFSEFRSRTALPFSLRDVEAITYRSGGEALVVEKMEGVWKILDPKVAAADPDEVRSLLELFEDLKIETFVDDQPEDLGPYGLEEGFAEIALTTREGEVALRLGRRSDEGGKLHAMRSGKESVFTLALEEELAGPRDVYLQLLDRRVLDFSTFEAESLLLRKGEVEKVFRKEEGKWKAGEQQAGGVGDLVLSLSSLQAIRFVDDGKEEGTYGLETPSIVVEVGMNDEAGTRHVVHFGDQADLEGRYGRVEGSEFVFVANPVLLQEITDLLNPPPDK